MSGSGTCWIPVEDAAVVECCCIVEWGSTLLILGLQKIFLFLIKIQPQHGESSNEDAYSVALVSLFYTYTVEATFCQLVIKTG